LSNKVEQFIGLKFHVDRGGGYSVQNGDKHARPPLGQRLTQ